MTSAPPLRSFQSLWAMEDLPTAAAAWTLDEQIDLLTGAGYDGLAVDLGARRAPRAADLERALRGTTLERMVFTFAGNDDELDEALTYADVIGAHEMVLCARTYVQDVREAADLISRWHDRAAASGVRLELETHRNTVTNDLRFTRRLLDELDPVVRLAVDLSHYIVGAEIPAEPSAEIEEQIAAILSRAGSLQGRIASRCQVQIPLHHAGSSPWIDLTRRWWRDGFAQIIAARTDDERDRPVTFVTELGTTPYALVDADGVELSDRWAEARLLLEWAEADLTAAAHSLSLPA